MKFLLIFVLFVGTSSSSYVLAATTSSVAANCKVAINSQLNGWGLAAVSEDVASWAKQNDFNPVIAVGDFDGNGKKDQAILLEHDKKRTIAVCLSKTKQIKLIIISDPYCSDLVYVSPAKGAHYNYDTDKTEKIKNDGISVSCFEKAGATYVYEHGAFRQIVDSD